ncbi:MAG: hypothetical protein RMX65_029890 [Nostoc sp. DedQUE01]|nr:hypothetical protein [Nostoc sp. DedQUE01]
MQQNKCKYSLKYSILGSIVLLLAFNSDPSSSYARSNIFILDNSGSMGCARDTKFSDKVDKVHPERCESSLKYPVDIGRLSIIEQIDQLSSSNSEVALIEMGGVTTTAPEELTKIKKETCLVRKAIELTKNITSFKDQINNKELIIPNHSGSTGTGKALDLAWNMVKDKQGERRLVIMTDGEPNCGVPVCDVVDGIDREIKDTPNQVKILKEIRILYGSGTQELNEDSMKKSYGCLDKIATDVNYKNINTPALQPINPLWLLLPSILILGFVGFKSRKFVSDLRQDTLIFILDASQKMSDEVDVIWNGSEKNIRKIDIAKMIIEKQIFADKNRFIKIGLAIFGIDYNPNYYLIKEPAFKQHTEIIRTLIKTVPEGQAPLADVLEKILKEQILERYCDDIPKEILREEILKEEIQKEIQKEKEKLKAAIEEEIRQRHRGNISEQELEEKVNEEIEQRYTDNISKQELEQKVETRLEEEIQRNYSRKPIKKLISRIKKSSVPHIILLTSSYDTCDGSPIMIIKKLEKYIKFVIYIIDYSEKYSSDSSSLERFARSSEKIRLFRYDEQDYFDVVLKTVDLSFNKKNKINNSNKSSGRGTLRVEKQNNNQRWWVRDVAKQYGEPLIQHKSDTELSCDGEFPLNLGSYRLYVKYVDSSVTETGKTKTSGELQRLEEDRKARQEEWNLRNKKINKLRLRRISVTSAAVQFELDQQIEEEKTEQKALREELKKIEQAIANPDCPSNDKIYDTYLDFDIKENDITRVPIPKKDS